VKLIVPHTNGNNSWPAGTKGEILEVYTNSGTVAGNDSVRTDDLDSQLVFKLVPFAEHCIYG
jgi:hypothetical protein